MENTTHTTREGWLVAATALLDPIIRDRTGVKPKPVRVSCGWPASRGRASKNRTIGQCFTTEGKVPQLFISPVLDNVLHGENGAIGYGVLPTLAHELLHAYLPHGTGHKKPFAKAAKALGLEGKPTSTYASDEFIQVCEGLMTKLGPYPHEALSAEGKKQTTRMLKVVCPECGYTIRTTSKWLEVGTPTCPCGTLMVSEYDEDERLEHIKLTAQEQEWTTKDGRFTLRMRTERNKSAWFLIDWENETGPRMLSVDDKYQGLDLMDSIREGLTTFEELEDDQDDLPEFEEDDRQDDEADWEDVQYLGDDEEEFPDYEDSIFTPDETEEYEAMMKYREDQVTA